YFSFTYIFFSRPIFAVFMSTFISSCYFTFPFFFFFNDTATTEIYTLSLHDALPISVCLGTACYIKGAPQLVTAVEDKVRIKAGEDRKSTRLNSSHQIISYAVFCLKKKKKQKKTIHMKKNKLRLETNHYNTRAYNSLHTSNRHRHISTNRRHRSIAIVQR